MTAGGFAVGSALLIPREVPRHDVRTRHYLDGFADRLLDLTADGVKAKQLAVAVLVHPLADELRSIVEKEMQRRGLSEAGIVDRLVGGAR